MADIQMMEEKWRIVFKLIDIDKNGLVTVKDRDDCKNNFSNLSPQDCVQLSAHLDQFWDNLIFHGESPDWSQEINEDEFVSRFKDVYLKDKATVQQRVGDALNNLLHAADLNKNGVFTFEKFFKFHEAFNLGHDVVVRTTFDLVRPSSDDTCTFGMVYDFYVELFIGEDKEKFESLKNAYRAIGML
jgi:Ca2+-binding EF-hand superfamily protein